MISTIFLFATIIIAVVRGNPMPDGEMQVNIDPNCGYTSAYTECVQSNTQAMWRCGITDYPCKCTLTKAMYACYQACPNDAGVQNAAQIVKMQVEQQCLAVSQFASILPFTTTSAGPNATGLAGLPTSGNMTKDQFDQLLRYPSGSVRLYNPFSVACNLIRVISTETVYLIQRAIVFTSTLRSA